MCHAVTSLRSVSWTTCGGSAEAFDEGAQLPQVAALHDLVAVPGVLADDGVAAVPGGPGLGVEPEQVPTAAGDPAERVGARRVVVRAGVAQDQHRGAGTQVTGVIPPEGLDGVAVVRTAVQPDAEAEPVD